MIREFSAEKRCPMPVGSRRDTLRKGMLTQPILWCATTERRLFVFHF